VTNVVGAILVVPDDLSLERQVKYLGRERNRRRDQYRHGDQAVAPWPGDLGDEQPTSDAGEKTRRDMRAEE
jgi:hypothetical protein